MPSGHAHRIVTVVAAPLVGMTSGYVAATLGDGVGVQDGFRAAIATMLGMAATLAINPDLDLLESSFKSKVRRKSLLLPWWLLWMPYSMSIPHRSPYSHAPIFGTLVRITYLFVVISLVLGILVIAGLIPPEIFQGASNFPAWLLRWFIVGMVASDALHWLMDTVSS